MTTNMIPSLCYKARVDSIRAHRWVERGKTDDIRSLSGSSLQWVLELDDCRLFLNQTFGLDLRAVEIVDAKGDVGKTVKEFCGGLLDRSSRHAWKPAIRDKHLSLRDRVSVCSTLFSVRKVLGNERPACQPYIRKMSQAQSPPSAKFLAFVRREVKRIFGQSWDRSYSDFVKGFTPPTKSNIDRETGGTYRERAAGNEVYRTECQEALTGRGAKFSRDVRAKAVQCGGKWRIITLSDYRLSHLLPLHRTIYARLTKEKWLLRGEATEDQFSEFGVREGEVFVSGDYESATDNLNVHVTRAVLESLLSTATLVPTKIRDMALESLQLRFVSRNGDLLGVHRRGQLMGSPLSFPLLCLINYLTFKYAIPREVPVAINGDDIVFRSTVEEKDRWFREVSASGLVVSRSKTMVHRRVFSLNSQYFIALPIGCMMPGHFRWSLTKPCDGMVSLAGRIKRLRGDLHRVDWRLVDRFLEKVLRKNLRVIYSSQGSISRRYGTRIPSRSLSRLGLLERESFYTNLAFEPSPTGVFTGWAQDVLPKEWKKESAVRRGDVVVTDQEFRDQMVKGSWEAAVRVESKDDWWARVRKDTFRYVAFRKKTYSLYAKVFGKFVPTPVKRSNEKEKVWVKRVDPSIEVSTVEP